MKILTASHDPMKSMIAHYFIKHLKTVTRFIIASALFINLSRCSPWLFILDDNFKQGNRLDESNCINTPSGADRTCRSMQSE